MSNSESPTPCVKWLNAFPRHDWYFEISPSRAFAHAEGDYDTQYGLDPGILNVGMGAVALLRERGCDFTGPALEIGCGTGLLTLGLVAADAYPAVVVTDPSPEFLHITREKLENNPQVDTGKTFFATLTGEQLAQLPENTFSLIILRSVLHHVLDVEEFIASTARALKPGGALVCEEPCAEGYLVMGLLAQFIPVVMQQEGKPLTPEQVEHVGHFCDTMKFYLRRDVDKSEAEDKHLFRVDEMMRYGDRSGLSTEFFSNLTFPEFLHHSPDTPKVFDNYFFMKSYLQYCMNFGEEFVRSFDETFAPYVRFCEEISQGGGGAPFHGVFLWRKKKAEQLILDGSAGLKIAIVNTYDLRGGAARAAWRLHSGLRQNGQGSRMFVLHRTSQDPDVRAVLADKSPETVEQYARWTRAAVSRIDRRRTALSETYFSAPVPAYDLSLNPDVRQSDIIHLHWVSGMLSPSGVRALLALNKPVVWTLHDMRAFTGGCHFSAGCEGFRLDCAACPQLKSDSADLPERALREALEQIEANRITIVCLSRWMENCVRQSALFRNCSIERIPNGLETDIYRVRDKAESRRALGLPADGFYFLFGADSAHDRRKGTHVLIEAARLARLEPEFQAAVDEGRIRFLTYGWDSDRLGYEGLPVKSLGYIEDSETMALAYAAADVFVCPTLEDNLPNTILEALSCGRPVIASDVGGVPDLVRDGVNGRLVAPSNPQALAEAMMQVVGLPNELAAWGVAARQGIEENHGLEHQSNRYLELYKDLMREERPQPLALPPESFVLPLLPSTWEFDQPDAVASTGAVEKPQIAPMEIAWTHQDGLDFKPSWKRDQLFINSEHARIWERTQHLPGWQDYADSFKLYEMAYYSGQVILEIGVFGGRSAAVELCGAMLGQTGALPQYYGVDIDPGFLDRSLASVREFEVGDRCLFYHGNLQSFVRKIPIVPTMVFLDGDHEYEGVIADLRTLRDFLAPGTPVLCHDYHGIEGVRRAVDEALESPYFRMMGLFAGCALLQATDACLGIPAGLDEADFQKTRLALLDRYKTTLNQSPERSDWPYWSSPVGLMPPTLPSGRPWPRISIITPSFNQGQYIEQTILSVAFQHYPDVEHIVMDGGSKDGTVAVLEKYSPLLSYWVSGKDGGQSNAINKGFARATGEIITWLNSDDLLAPGALVAIAMAFDSSAADMVAGICQIHRDNQIFDQHLTSCTDGPLPLAELLDLENCWMSGQFFFQPEVFFKRELLLKVGGSVNEKAHWSMDYDLWVRFAQAGAILKVIGRPVAQFRVHEEQKTHDISGFKNELQAIIDKIRPTLQMPPSPPPLKGRKAKLKIVFFNDLGFRYGAGIAHHRIARAAQLAGHEVIPVSVGIDNLTDTEKALPFAAQIVPYLKSLEPDMVLVGNIHAAGLGAKFLKELAEALPTVFLLHDGWLLTGRCAYRGACTKNLTGCDQTCPTSGEYPPLPPADIAAAWESKMSLLQNTSKLVLAANSRWNEQQVRTVATALQAAPDAPVNRPLTVRLGVPLKIFYPRDRTASRNALNLPSDKFILLFSCNNLSDKRKGMDHLIKALSLLDLPDLIPVCIGYNDGKTKLVLPNLISVGLIDDPEQQALLYSAADLFVAPSLEEAFGQVFIEAAACGTPSVAYPVGGVPEALVDGVGGRLAKAVHPDSLAEAIKELYVNHRLRRNLGFWGRHHVENEFSQESMCHSAFFAFRAATKQAGIDLVPKLKLQVDPKPLPAVTILLETFGYIKYPSAPTEMTAQQFEFALLDYYQQQVRSFRHRSTPWWLKPKAWLARINRESMRKQIARRAKKRKG
jgi:glycosyltransferase involved in cell wall biosynthesis/SAM-dependent methyltransferase